jgi:uncharacterized protein YjbJ (UPF0337 family)
LVTCDDKEITMSKLREKAEGRTKEMVGQMIGDQKLEREGKEEAQNAERADDKSAEPRRRSNRKQRSE